MSRRTERIGSLIRQIVADAIQSRLSDPRIERLTSVTRVEVTADMSLARVHVSVLAPPARRKLTLTALHSAARRMRAVVAEQLSTRTTPEIAFCLDESIQHGIETQRAIDEALAASGLRSTWDADASNDDEDEGTAPRPDAALDPPADDSDRQEVRQ